MVEETKAQIISAMMQAGRIAEGAGAEVQITAHFGGNPHAYAEYFATVGDYHVWKFPHCERLSWDYMPSGKTGEWSMDVDPARIVSFTMPPIGEQP